MQLEKGESTSVQILASKKWNDTGLEVAAGETYDFTAAGTWTDLVFTHNADGGTNWYMNLFNNKKRSTAHLWFALMGSIDQSIPFLIGTSSTIRFTSSGTLYCFANDANGFYWNNCGKLTLTITRN